MGIACDRATVAAAVAAASSGDTITLNAGTETWTSAIAIDKKLTIIGAGSSSTVITDWAFSVADGVDDWRISGIGWTNSSLTYLQFPISFGGADSADGCRGLRIDNCTFSGYTRPLAASGRCTGVIDNCTFSGLGSDGIRVRGSQASAWSEAVVWGNSDWLFFEDCEFDNAGADANAMFMMEHGARVVIRYNTFTDDATATDDIGTFIDAHGFGHGTDQRGTMSYEIYHNTLNKEFNSWPRGLHLRGGSGVVWSNAFNDLASGYFNPAIRLIEYRAADGTGISVIYQWAYTQEGYPAIDQIGRGPDIAGDRTNQEFKGLYCWDNVNELDAAVVPAVSTSVVNPDYIQLDRDYFNAAPDGYTSYTYPHPLRGETVSFHRNRVRIF